MGVQASVAEDLVGVQASVASVAEDLVVAVLLVGFSVVRLRMFHAPGIARFVPGHRGRQSPIEENR